MQKGKKTLLVIIALCGLMVMPSMNNNAYAEIIYSVEQNGEASISGNTNNFKMVGEGITGGSELNGRSIDALTIFISCNHVTANNCNDFTENYYVGIWNSTIAPTDSNQLLAIDNAPASDLTETLQSFSFSFSSFLLTEDMVIGVYFDEDLDTNSNNFVSIGIASPQTFDGANTLTTRSSQAGAWSTTATDIAGVISVGEVPDEVCIDTDLNGITDLCFEDTNNDGIPDNGQFGSLKAFQSNSNVTQLGTDWFCAFNIGNACNDANVQTNGVGIFYLLIIIIFSYAFLVAIHIMAMKASPNGVNVTQALAIHPILLLVMLFIDVGLSWYLGFIEDTVFYSVLVIMVGLGGFGIYRMVTKDN